MLCMRPACTSCKAWLWCFWTSELRICSFFPIHLFLCFLACVHALCGALLSQNPPYTASGCCSLFVVHKKRVLLRPKAAYVAMLEYAKTIVSIYKSPVPLRCHRACCCLVRCGSCCQTVPAAVQRVRAVQDPRNRINWNWASDVYSYMWHFVFGQPWRTFPYDPNFLCPRNPGTCSLGGVVGYDC